jgi:hypothetical protein
MNKGMSFMGTNYFGSFMFILEPEPDAATNAITFFPSNITLYLVFALVRENLR